MHLSSKILWLMQFLCENKNCAHLYHFSQKHLHCITKYSFDRVAKKEQCFGHFRLVPKKENKCIAINRYVYKTKHVYKWIESFQLNRPIKYSKQSTTGKVQRSERVCWWNQQFVNVYITKNNKNNFFINNQFETFMEVIHF